jgi:hypothetical protein
MDEGSHTAGHAWIKPGDNFFALRTCQPLLPLDLKRGRSLGLRSAALSADINRDAFYDAAGRQKRLFAASRSASTPRSNI